MKIPILKIPKKNDFSKDSTFIPQTYSYLLNLSKTDNFDKKMSFEKINKESSSEDSDFELEKTIREIKKTSRFPGNTRKCTVTITANKY